MTLTQRIRNAIERVGLINLPQDKHVTLEQGGLDSLMLALLIIELEREFKIKIPVMPLVKEHYESIDTIEKHLTELGAK
ncbi:acyl carrier protein [Legionella maioricensis]|uniref:Acyl carrier protein n=1 Tax=Legionella maioricensis TaxID=2896528 RepID=A0A9X2IBS6_9GAMM|nr:acyl carrier protein [Legionella maioricensis]MCL9684710.1 acyl carrier protein [Legionella maioricensis]MCL9687738.1 acyl carrier protein [Legionella maioricensis]